MVYVEGKSLHSSLRFRLQHNEYQKPHFVLSPVYKTSIVKLYSTRLARNLEICACVSVCVCVLVSLQKYGKYRWIFAFCKTTEYVPSMCYRSYTPLIFSLISFVLLLTVDSFSFYFLCKKIFYYLFILHRRLRVKNAIYFNRHLWCWLFNAHSHFTNL